MRAAVIALSLAACAPDVGGPVERQRAVDRADADRLAAQLQALPGAVRAEVTLHRPVVEPLGGRALPGGAAVLVVVDDRADRAAVASGARRLAHATAPELEPAIAVEVGAVRPELARVGPFTVEAGSRRALASALVAALALITVLAAWIAWRERPRLQ